MGGGWLQEHGDLANINHLAGDMGVNAGSFYKCANDRLSCFLHGQHKDFNPRQCHIINFSLSNENCYFTWNSFMKKLGLGFLSGAEETRDCQ